MKPRRWYNGPEVNPLPKPPAVCPVPTALYWAFTTLTYREQGAIIKSDAPAPPTAAQRRAATVVQLDDLLQRIDAA